MSNSRPAFINALFISTLFPISVILGCSSNSEGIGTKLAIQKIENIDKILTVEDVESTGWKRGKTYDIDGLTGAEAAYVGFWTPPGLNSLNYEIRIYPSHQAAVKQGTPFAEDASGTNASLSKKDALWSEGVRDRRMIVGGGLSRKSKPSIWRLRDLWQFSNPVRRANFGTLS